MFSFGSEIESSQESGRLQALFAELRSQAEKAERSEMVSKGMADLRQSVRELAWQRLTRSTH